MTKTLKIKKKDLISSFYNYAAGYYEAGIDLIDILLNENRYNELPNPFREEYILLEEECKIYPIMFLFRQYIELIVKALYLQFDIKEEYNNQEINIFTKHSLQKIWPNLKIKLENIENENYDDFGDIVPILDETIKWFSSVDDDSCSFRFPANHKLQLYHNDDEKYDLSEIKYLVTEFDDLIHYFI